MIPMRTKSIFKSRWLALLWAAGTLWFALDVSSGGDSGGSDRSDGGENVADGASASSDAPVTPAEATALAGALGG